MSTRRVLSLALIAATAAAIGQSVWSRSLPLTEDQIRERPATSAANVVKAPCAANHNIGKISLCQTNYGTFGTGFVQANNTKDCFTGAALKSCEFPKGSGVDYLFAGAFWIGAVVGRDTMVSVGADGWQNCREMDPEESPIGDMKHRSIIDPSSSEYIGAKSEQDIIGLYTDSFTTGVSGLCTGQNDPVNGIGHRPLKIEISERSYAWSYSYAEDFVLFDYTITNAGTRALSNVYMGVYVDGDVGATADANKAQDDVTGFKQTIPTPPAFSGGCSGMHQPCADSFYDWVDEVNLAWIADNDGNWSDPLNTPATSVTGTRIVRTPNDTLYVSYNWWIGNANKDLDFGPQKQATYRDLGTGGHGTPEGDRNKYWYLRNKEFDYDQAFTCRYYLDPVWVPVSQSLCQTLSKGYDTRYLLSFGPFNMQPGAALPLSFAYVAGEGFHRSDRKTNGTYLTDPTKYNPEQWYANVDFTDLSLNSVWASWIYDNPGYSETPGGFLGKYRVCCASGKPDTLYLTGDGEPDFKGASPPPAPTVWAYGSEREVRVRFNGFRSETTKDVFSKIRDFEGYRVYLSLDDRPASFSMIESYDIADYNKWIYNPNKTGGAGYELKNTPFTLRQLDSLYGLGPDDSTFNPLRYTVNNPYHKPGFPDSIFYFVGQDYNRSRMGVDTRITKIYPDAIYPPYALPDSVPADSHSVYLTDDGYFKYFEYQLVIQNLLPTIPYYVNVTAFDFGSPASGLGSLETSPTVGYKTTYAIAAFSRGTSTSKEVYVFPNPYRLDGGYQADGYEGRDPFSRGKAPDRQRRVHFANVPDKCTIRIFTLDGDLVKEIPHPDVINECTEDPNVACWDLITRNTQLVVSGIYYWTIEDEKGNTQIGKLVIIM
jgi:hypothetical protein